VNIVNDDERRMDRDICHHPIQAMHYRKGIAGERTRMRQIRSDDRCRQSRRAGKQHVALVLRCRPQARLKQLAHYAVGKVPLLLTSPGSKNGHGGAFGQPASFGQQDCLAYSRDTLNNDEPACARCQPGNSVRQFTDVAIAL
jgi:hypothetical protein